MNRFVKIYILYSILQNVESKALAGVKKTFQFELVPFKHLSVFLEHVSPFGKFELKHSLEKRNTVEEPIPNEIPVAVEEKKVLLTSVVTPPVEVAPVPVPAPVLEPTPEVVPFVIELAPKVPVVPEPVKEPVPVVSLVPKVPVMYTDITQLPLYNFAFPQPVQVPYPIHIEVPVKPEPIAAPADPIEPVPAVPVEPVPAVPVVPVEPVPVPVFTEPPVVEVPVKPEVVVQEVKPVAPPLPNYLVKGSRLIIFFGSKILQMLSQFVDGKSFAEFSLPLLPPLPALAKKK